MLGALAHGIGGREDLPLPLGWAIAGAAVAVLVSFVALGLLWRTPHLDGPRAGRPLWPGPARLLDSRTTRRLIAGAGLVVAAYVLLAILFGASDTDNPTPWVVYILVWVGLVPLSVLLGPVWRLVNPIRTVHALLNRALGLDPRAGLTPLPPSLGYWPAAVGLFAFTWLELVAPDNADLATLRLAIGLYAAVQLFAGLLYGSSWFDRGDAFEVWSGLFGRFSVLGRRADGVLVLRSPLAGLDALRPAPGLVATVMVMLGSTAYDGLSGTTWWTTTVQESPAPSVVVKSLGLLGAVLLLTLVFVACTTAAGLLGGRVEPERAAADGLTGSMPALFAPSVVPVALGYVVAHYYSLLVLEGQRAFIKLSDPLGTGADWLGTGGLKPATAWVDPQLVVAVQVIAIVLGHIVGVVLAHERAVRLFSRRAAVIGQLPLVVLMVALTCTGLFLLFAV